MSDAASFPSSLPPIPGFLLTRQQLDQADGICLRYWICGPDGPFSVDIPAQEAVFFIHDEQLDAARTALAGLSGWRLAKVDLQDLNQLAVSALYTTSLKSQRQAIERLQRAGVALLEEDIRHADRYLMERFIQGSVTVYQRNQQVLLKPGNYVPEFSVLSIDLETTMRADKILSIGLYSDHLQLVLMTGKGENQPGLEFVPDERRLLRRFVEVVRAEDPDIFIGWNVVGFDFRVLYQRAEALQMPLLLGRDKQPLQLHQSGQGKWYARLSGRIVLDGIDTMKGATF
uniref:3'-5' exonuclease n=1 Tax=Pontibacterium sp. TaxID=2036026 RepID=UPI00356764E6